MQDPNGTRAGASPADEHGSCGAAEAPAACELIERCATSDCPASWQEFFERYGRPIRHAVRRTLLKVEGVVKREHEEDLLQETYCKLLANGRRRLRQFRGGDDRRVAGYLSRIAENVVRDQLRRRRTIKRGRDVCLVAGDGEDGLVRRAVDPHAEADRRALVAEGRRLYFERGSRALPGDNRIRDLEVTYLSVFEGWSSREIADRWRSLTANNVDSIVHRTRCRLEAVEIHLRRPAPGKAVS